MALKSEKIRVNRKLVTLVLHAENLELRKDPGQIPYHAHKVLGFDSTLVTYYYSIEKGRLGGPIQPPNDPEQIKKDYPFLDTEVSGLKTYFLPLKGRKRFYEKAVYEYLRSNSKNIDVLNLVHFGSENIFYGLIYKYFNPKGKIYLKLDIDLDFYFKLKNVLQIGQMPVIGKLMEKAIMQLFFLNTSLISVESLKGLAYFKKRFNVSPKKLIYLPNGVDQDRALTLIPKIRAFHEKENIILTVGRIGNIQKNNEMLMQVIAQMDLKDWKVYFVGPMEKDFQSMVDDYFAKYPHLKAKVFFTGAATSTQELYEYYNKAKIFCMTSRWESFCIAAAEAMYFGAVPVLSSSFTALDDFIQKGKTGFSFLVNETKTLQNLLSHLINQPENLNEMYSEVKSHADQNYVWQKNIQSLKGLL